MKKAYEFIEGLINKKPIPCMIFLLSISAIVIAFSIIGYLRYFN